MSPENDHEFPSFSVHRQLRIEKPFDLPFFSFFCGFRRGLDALRPDDVALKCSLLPSQEKVPLETEWEIMAWARLN